MAAFKLIPPLNMLSSFHIKNFRSILDVNLNFSYSEGKAPNGYQNQDMLPFVEAGGDCRLVPCMAFFGANASGKTNLLKSLGMLRYLVVKAPPLSEAFEPNLLNSKFSATTFNLAFTLSDELYTYSITYNSKQIMAESLARGGTTLYSIECLDAEFSKEILSDAYSNQKLSEILGVECSNGEGAQIKSFLNCIGRGYIGLNKNLSNVFRFFATSLHLMHTDALILPVAVEVLAQAMEGNQEAALAEITDVVRRLDIDINRIEIAQKEIGLNEDSPVGITKINQDTGVKHMVSIRSSHKNIEGKLAWLDFIEHESAGTQRLAGMIGLILYSLKIGGVLLIDELECSVHPLLMRELLMLFKARDHNKFGAQLIFTTHNTDILDDSILRISEIALVRKTLANGTVVRRLVDAKNEGEDIRNVTKFRRQYLAGFYSGIPHPAL